MNNKNKPIHEIRLSMIKASIWENQGGDTPRYNVTLSKIYKDGEDWKFTDTFGRDDLLLVSKIADRAHSWICDQPRTKATPRPE